MGLPLKWMAQRRKKKEKVFAWDSIHHAKCTECGEIRHISAAQYLGMQTSAPQ